MLYCELIVYFSTTGMLLSPFSLFYC